MRYRVGAPLAGGASLMGARVRDGAEKTGVWVGWFVDAKGHQRECPRVPSEGPLTSRRTTIQSPSSLKEKQIHWSLEMCNHCNYDQHHMTTARCA